MDNSLNLANKHEQLRLCTICVRGGSKGVPGKNTRLLAGKPLLAHSIEQAKASGVFAAVGVSSDSEEILEVAKTYGADNLIKRPDALATDTSAKLPAIQHCVAAIEAERGQRFDAFVDLDVTSPLRWPSDIVATLEILKLPGVELVITASAARRSPYFNMVEVDEAGGVFLAKNSELPIVRRQDAPVCYDLNASIYTWSREGLLGACGLFGKRTRLYVMPMERSFDIDTLLDWQIVEFLIARSVLAGSSQG